MIFGELESFINILEKLKSYIPFLKQSKNKEQASTETISARFVRLFESHGVHRNQIPRFFDHGLTIKDLKDDDSLLACLTETILEDACELFAVRREWLDGADNIAHKNHDFYKEPQEIIKLINELRTKNPDGQLHGELYAPEKPDFQSQAIIVLREIIGNVSDEPIYRYHLCNNWRYDYWKSRAYLTACVAIAWKNGVYLMATNGSKKEINQFATGEKLLAGADESIIGSRWHPEDLALKPEVYLKDIDPERKNFGIYSALSMWIDLDKQGLMKTGLPNTGNPRELFVQELAKYTS